MAAKVFVWEIKHIVNCKTQDNSLVIVCCESLYQNPCDTYAGGDPHE